VATLSRLPVLAPHAPSLPLASQLYAEDWQNKYSNVLRLYFNDLDNLFQSLLSPTGGSTLQFPYGAFHQDGTTTLTAGITNNSTTPIPVVSTASFPSGGGYILVGTEIIQYTSTTATTFGGTITRGVLGTSGNKASWPSGSQVSEVQGTGTGTTIGTVKFNNIDYSNGVGINTADISQVVFSNAGIYNIQISTQCLNFTNAVDNITIWLALNGTDLPATASVEAVPASHGGVAGAIIFTFNVFQRFNVGDYLQVRWTSDSGNSVIATYPAGLTPVHPLSPAIILTAQFVSALPA
jgi:hypothetical protein